MYVFEIEYQLVKIESIKNYLKNCSLLLARARQEQNKAKSVLLNLSCLVWIA